MSTMNLIKVISLLLIASLSSASLAQQPNYSKITLVYSDADGTPFAATDQAGNEEWKIEHRPYGEEHSNTQVVRKNNLSFAGKPYDEEIGLSYFGARWYDPALGRFTGVDAAPVNPNDYRTFNRYAYGNNNPYKYTDPDGKIAFLIPIAIFIAKELAAEAASQATGGATDFLSVRRLGTKAVKRGAKFLKNRRGNLARNKGCCCFDEGTPVKTEAGFSPIEEIKVGDLVYSYDEKTGETVLKPVTELFITDPKPLYELVLKDVSSVEDRFVVTDNHPYWVEGTGWVDSAELDAAMQIKTFDGSLLDVVSNNLKQEVKPTYNFTVADTHTYFAGESEALVHNCNCGTATKGTTLGGGATLDKLTPGEMKRIQNAADRSGKDITVVGSRVNPKKELHSKSDFDFVIDANSKTRNNLSRSLPGSKSVNEGISGKQDIFKGAVNKNKPHATFKPGGG